MSDPRYVVPRTEQRLWNRCVRAGVSAIAMIAAASCDPESSSRATSRSDQVRVEGGATPGASASPTPSASAAHEPPKGPRKLCAAASGTSVTELRKLSAPVLVPRGDATEGPRPPFSAGRLTWINFWAAWCGPCKEELPRLRDWEKRFRAAGVAVDVTLVSIDDDRRQLVEYIDRNTWKGFRTLWLDDGPARAQVLRAFAMKSAPQLPAHAIVDARGSLRCFIDGAVEEADYPQALEALR